jgi:transposase
MIHKGGDKVFSDYSGDGLEYVDRRTGEIVPVDLFVCAWGASSYTFAEGSESQKTPDFTRSHVQKAALKKPTDTIQSPIQYTERWLRITI